MNTTSRANGDERHFVTYPVGLSRQMKASIRPDSTTTNIKTALLLISRKIGEIEEAICSNG